MLTTTMYDLGKVLLQSVPSLLQVESTTADTGNLEFKIELPSDHDTASLETNIPAANVLLGNHFGTHDVALGAKSSAVTAEYESLNVSAIPEPSSIGIVTASLLGGYAIGRFWRRRQAKSNA